MARTATGTAGESKHPAGVIAGLALLGLALGTVALVEPKTASAADRDCADFSSQREAQDYLESQGGPSSDPDRLDADGDGKACASLPCPCGSGSPGTGRDGEQGDRESVDVDFPAVGALAGSADDIPAPSLLACRFT